MSIHPLPTTNSNAKHNLIRIGLAACALASTALGCSSEWDQTEISGSSIYLESVPPGVQCISVIASGSEVVEQAFEVAPGQADVTLDLGPLPLGKLQIDGRAFTKACTAQLQAPNQEPAWIADTEQLEVFAGLPAHVGMTFRRHEPGSGTAEFVESVVGVAVGSRATYAIAPDGGVYVWGDYPVMLGPGAPASLSSPTLFPGLTDIVQVTVGGLHACALDDAGAVLCWGGNSQGQLGDGTTAGRATPLPVTGLPADIISISSGVHFSCAITSELRRWCWGGNFAGQLGDGTKLNRPIAVVAGFGKFAKSSGSAQHSCGLTAEGTIYCSGRNSSGQLGDGGTASRAYMALSQAGAGFVDIAAGGNYTCAARTDGLVKCWGGNARGSLGDGTATNRSTPISTLVDGVVTRIEAGGTTTCALEDAGSVLCWGGNTHGTVGDGTGINSRVPITVPGLENIVDISLGGNNACAITQDGRLFCWGARTGDGSMLARFQPVEITL